MYFALFTISFFMAVATAINAASLPTDITQKGTLTVTVYNATFTRANEGDAVSVHLSLTGAPVAATKAVTANKAGVFVYNNEFSFANRTEADFVEYNAVSTSSGSGTIVGYGLQSVAQVVAWEKNNCKVIPKMRMFPESSMAVKLCFQ